MTEQDVKLDYLMAGDKSEDHERRQPEGAKDIPATTA
jgi:hypothetical protein